ncbi:hypothetical protein ACFSE1_08780 [Rhizobium helianthi]|uniref:Uncharacterized protein n=1 Tax=Rhizobium helianthi TaxID=1132695 RepID=A0ABW4M2E3_9HYPH
MSEHLHEASSNGQLDVGGQQSAVGYKMVAKQQEDGSVRIAISVMAPRDWLLKQGFKRDAVLVRKDGDRLPVSFDGELDVTDSISVSLRAPDQSFPDLNAAQAQFPELSEAAH